MRDGNQLRDEGLSISLTTFLTEDEGARESHATSVTARSQSLYHNPWVSHEYKSAAATPLEKRIIKKKKVTGKSLYNQSQLEEKAGPGWDLLNRT